MGNSTIPKYPVRRLNNKITLCVEPALKALWDKLIRQERRQLPEATREFLRDLLPKLAKEIEAES